MSYIKNLLEALMGRDPFQKELNKVKQEFEKTREKVDLLSMFCEQLKDVLQQQDSLIASYQTLVENFRRRLAEKEDDIRLYRKELKEAYDQLKRDNHERE